MNFSLWVQKHQTKVGFDPRPPESASVTSTEVLNTRISGLCQRLSQQSVLFEQQNLFRSESYCNHSKFKKCVKKSLEKSKIIPEEKRKNSHAKNRNKKHKYTIIAFYSRAIKKPNKRYIPKNEKNQAKKKQTEKIPRKLIQILKKLP